MSSSVHRHSKNYQEMENSSTLFDFSLMLNQSDIGMPFDRYESLLMKMPNLQRFRSRFDVQINADHLCELGYIDGENWNRIRGQFHQLVNFDCSITCQLESSVNLDILYDKVRASFSASPDWYIKIDGEYIKRIFVSSKCPSSSVFPSRRERLRFNIDNLEYLRFTDGNQIMVDLNNINVLSIECTLDTDNNVEDDDNDPSSLILPDCNLPKLRKLEVGAIYRAEFHDPFLQAFLQQLFRRAPNLVSIETFYDEDSGGLLEDFVDFLRSFPDPLTQVKECEIKCAIHDWTATLISDIAFYLPSLTTFILDDVNVDIDELAEMMSLCIIHMRHLSYLNISSWSTRIIGENEITDTHSWLEKCTILGGSMSKIVFEAELSNTGMAIWLERE
jgi:hypothetical protein